MRKIERTETVTDDVDGKPDAAERVFEVGGKEYRLDLTDANASKLEKAAAAIAPFMVAARPVRSASNGNVATGNAGAIREWARANGLEVSERGAISAEVRAAYEAAQVSEPVPA